MNDRNRRGALKILFLALLCVFAGALASGCTLSENSVKLHTKEEMQKLVDERYGGAEFIGVEDVKEPHRKRVFTYRDKEYGFTYQVISQPNSVGMDGSTFYYDGASVRYEYEEPFLAYFKEQEADNFAARGIELCDTLSVSQSYDSDRMYSVKSKRLVSTMSKWEEDLQFAWDCIHKYTVPEMTMRYEIDVYDSFDNKFYGTMKAEGFVDAEAQRIDYYMDQAMQLGGIDGIEYLRTESKRVSEVPGLSEQEFYDQTVKDNNRKVNVYYFSYDGKEYFIVDVWVAQELKEEGIPPIFQYYQNYKHYDISGN